MRFSRGHFTDGLHIGQRDVLADLATEVGLDGDEALVVLDSDTYVHAGADPLARRRPGLRVVPGQQCRE